MLGVTLTPTMASASSKINVIPARAQVRIDCRVPPGLGEDAGAAAHRTRCWASRRDELRIEFTEQVVGNGSPVAERADGRRSTTWVAANDPGASTVPVILPGLLRLALVSRGVPRVRGLRLLPPAPPDDCWRPLR